MAERDIIARLKLKGEEFTAELRSRFGDVKVEAEKAGADAGEGFATGFGTKAAMLTAAGAGAIAIVGQLSRQSLDLARDLSSTSAELGIGVERLQEYRFAASQAGVQTQDLDGNIATLTKKIGEANGGNRDAQESFKDLGVGFENVAGKARRTEAVFVDVIQRLSQIKDPTERARLGTSLLGDEYQKLEPLVRGGADGIHAATEELREMQGVLSSAEIKNLNETNAKFDQMKTILSVRIASTVSENADAIIALADGLATLATKSVQVVRDYPRAIAMLGGGIVGMRLGGPVGAAAGMASGWVAGDEIDGGPERRATITEAIRQKTAADKYLEGRSDLSYADRLAARKMAHEGIERRLGVQSKSVGPSWIGLKDTRLLPEQAPSGAWYGEAATQGAWWQDDTAAPSVDPKPSGRSGAGRSSGAKRTGPTKEDRDNDRAWQNEERFRKAVEETTRAQEGSLQVERLRAAGNEEAAAAEEARIQFLRQHPLAVHQTVEELAKALGITRELTAEQRKQLQMDIDGADLAEKTAVDGAAAKVAKEKADKAREEAQREWENSVRDVADLYEDLFTGGTDSVWKSFKRQGIRIISEIAAQYTLAMLSGQSTGSLGGIAQSVIGQSPLGSLFNFGSRSGGLMPSNDNGGDLEKVFDEVMRRPTPKGVDAIPAGGALGGIGGFLASAAGPLMLASAANSIIGDIFGFKGGPLGIFTGLVSSTKRASATIGGSGDMLDVLGIRGNSSSRKQASGDAAGSIIDSLYEIADALGADIDAGRGSVSIGVRKKSFRLDTSGSGITKTSKGAIDFGEDQEAAIAAAVSDLIRDGVLTGISAASQAILQKGADLEKAIEKAVLIESVPKLLKQRLDPLGAQLEDIDAKFRDLAAALAEGGASAQQIAEARQLWQLERADTIKQIGEASSTLKDYLASLTVGSGSPFSLRQQLGTARSDFAPYEAQVSAAQAARAEVDRLRASGASEADIKAAETAARTAAGKIDQEGLQSAAQLLLNLTRSVDSSSGGFFAEFDRIRGILGDGIGAIDAATTTPGAGKDPFAQDTAANTKDIANLMLDNNDLLKAVNDNLVQLRATSGDLSWLSDSRNFT